MKKLLVASCLTLTILVSPSAYSADGPYLGANIGAAILNDSDVTDSTLPGIELELSYDTGLIFGAAVGYRVGNARTEVEVSYQENDIDDSSIFGISLDSTGDVTGTTFLLNVYYDLTNHTAFTPYVTAGLGFADIEINDYNIAGSGVPNFSDDDTVFAYQAGLGVGYALNDNFVIDARYRYFGTEDPEFDTTEAEIASHQFLLGIRYHF